MTSPTSDQAAFAAGPAVARRIVEAMRLGVVPSSEPSAWTVGRDSILAEVGDDLRRAGEGGALRAILGDYGAGKSHLLELIRHRAKAEGFATAGAVLDSQEVPPSHPKRVHRALMGSLEFPDAEWGRGVSALLRRGASSDEALRGFGVGSSEPKHLYLTPALRYARALWEGEDAQPRDVDAWESLVAWIGGEPTALTADVDSTLRRSVGGKGRIYSLKDYRPWARIYGYLLSGMGALCRQLGLRGLVVLIDEAEFYSLLSRENREFAELLFRALAFAAVGPDAGLPFGVDALDVGGAGRLKELPPRWSSVPGLYVVLAMTPHAEGELALRGAVAEASISELSKLTRDDYAELVHRVVDVVRDGSDAAAPPKAVAAPLATVVAGLVDAGWIESPRQAMKLTVDVLDVARHEPAALKPLLSELRDRVRR